jgi:hypothetical protein
MIKWMSVKLPDEAIGQRVRARMYRFGIGLFSVAVILILIGGVTFITRRDNADTPPHRLIGAVMLVSSIAVLAATARRWAKWFFAVCILAAAKAVFALIFGYTLPQPRLVTDRPLVFVILLLLIVLAFFSYRFVTSPPLLILDSVALVGAVIGLFTEIFTEPNPWPLLVAVVLLGTTRLLTHRPQRNP